MWSFLKTGSSFIYTKKRTELNGSISCEDLEITPTSHTKILAILSCHLLCPVVNNSFSEPCSHASLNNSAWSLVGSSLSIVEWKIQMQKLNLILLMAPCLHFKSIFNHLGIFTCFACVCLNARIHHGRNQGGLGDWSWVIMRLLSVGTGSTSY